jgi:phosphoglycolate phosphatase
VFKAIIFDLDGTLVDAYPGIHQSLNEMLRELQLPEVDLETVKRRVGRGTVNLMQQSVPHELVDRALALFRKSYGNTHLTGSFLLPNVREILVALEKSNILLGIASNKPVDFTRNILKHLQIDEYFCCCSGPEGQIQPKPHPSMLQDMMRKMGVSEKETLYVGDMTLDSETAKNAGVRLALIATGGHSKEELQNIQPDYLLEGLGDLVEIIERTRS